MAKYENETRQSQVEVARQFFSGLSLEDVFGRARENPRVIPISWDQYQAFSGNFHLARNFARTQGITEVGGVSNCGGENDGPSLHESITTPKLSWWLPHPRERALIIGMAQAVVGGRKPSILEVGYGSGLMAKLLAFDNNIQVTGIDLKENGESLDETKIPTLPNVSLLRADIWDKLDQYGPFFASAVAEERNRLLTQLRIEEPTVIVSEFLGGQIGVIDDFSEPVGRLQALGRQFLTESPIDVVICSFMALGKELTLPIRDGLMPKVIVYVKPNNLNSGAGDFYHASKWGLMDIDRLNEFDLETVSEVEIQSAWVKPNPDSSISFNPGRNYTTLATWPTLWQADIPHFGFPHSPRKIDRVSAQVVIQVRNDVVIPPFSPTVIPKFDFDREIEILLGDKSADFLAGITLGIS